MIIAMKDYIQKAKRTESTNFSELAGRLSIESNIRLLHAAFGMCTETGEFTDQLKKHIFYGKPLDVTNLKEEIGDAFWYFAIACDVLGVTFEELQERNIAKLTARYPDKFDENLALNRNLDKERETLTD